MLEIYLTRWRCEESFHFIKQGYNLEDIRLLTYEGFKKIIVASVHAVFYFLSVELGRNLKLSILLKKIYEKAKNPNSSSLPYLSLSTFFVVLSKSTKEYGF